MKTLVLIKSCWRHKEYRGAIRETWLPELTWADHRFLVGKHKPRKPFASVCENITGEPDLLIVPANDDYKGIAPKVRLGLAIVSGYDRIVVVDDDTYVRPDRLELLVCGSAAADYIGFPRYDNGELAYMQGSCFILSEVARRAIVAAIEIDKDFPDDPAIGKALQFKCRWLPTDRINVGPDCTLAIPYPQNQIVATHKCLPDVMRRVHQAWLASTSSAI